jgi:hypothetical protein
MAIKFLQKLDLQGNEIQNFKAHVASSTSGFVNAGEGSIWLDSGNNTLKFYVADTGSGSPGWLSVLDDTTSSMSFTLTADNSGSDQTISNGNTLDIAGGASITTTVGNTDTVTIDVTDNTIGTAELNVSGTGSSGQVLTSDGDGTMSWTAKTTNTNTQTTHVLSFVDSSNDIILRNTKSGAASGDDDIKFVAGNNITLTHTDADNITITATDTNTTYSEATTSAEGLMSTAHHDKLDGIATSANNYTHPTGAGNKHIPTGGSSGQFLKYSASGTAVWAADNNTTYSIGDGGLTTNDFTNADHTKLNNIEASADVTDTANVKSALNASMGGAATIGDGSDTITIPGDLTVTGTTTTNNVETVSTSNGVQFEGSAANSHEIMLKAGTVSADRTITLPDATGTVALTSDISGTNSNTNTGDQLVFKTISVSGQSDVVADTTTDTLTLTAAGGMTITTSGDAITLSSADTNTTYSEATGSAEGLMSTAHHDKLDGIEASADVNLTAAQTRTLVGTGNNGVIPAAGTSGHFLKHDGTFGIPAYTTNTNTTYSATTNGGLTLSSNAFSIAKFEGALADATTDISKSSNTYTITHGLGNCRVNVMVTTVASPYEQVFPEINYADATGTGTVLVIFGQSVSDDAYNVTITK